MIIVTGANGFVGQHLVPQLLKIFPKEEIYCCTGVARKKHEIIGLRILESLNVKILKIDLLKKNTLKKIPVNPRVLIHLAASVDTSKVDFRANDIGTKNLVEAVGVNNETQILFTSTAAVWSGRKNCTKPILSTDPVYPNNSYGRTKVVAERYLQSVAASSGSRLTILRLNTIFGPDPRSDKLFGVMQCYIKRNSIIARINWPGKFGIVHVDDVVKSIIHFLNHPSKSEKVRIEIVSSENITLPKISSIMHQEMGKDFKPITVPKVFWRISKNVITNLKTLEPFLPPFMFNPLWRFSLIADDVLKAKTSDFFRTHGYQSKHFDTHGKDVLVKLDS